MGDWAILRLPYDEPDNPEVIEILANRPMDWQKYLKKKAIEINKEGRYIASSLHYNNEYYYPESMEYKHKKKEKESECQHGKKKFECLDAACEFAREV